MATGEIEVSETRGIKRYAFLLVIAASALAHLWCLGSQFFMDDMPGIFEKPGVTEGKFWDERWLMWTHLFYFIQFKFFGASPVAFHAVNWLLHTSVACVLFAFGRRFLRGPAAEGTALFAALLFAVHPLASEIPNYARTQDLAWVTLFSLLGAWAMLSFLRDGGWKKLLVVGVCIAGAAVSKGPGLFHALMMTSGVVAACLDAEGWRKLRRFLPWMACVLVLGVSALWATGEMTRLTMAVHRWEQPRFIGHAYTLSRVFWEFAWRAIIPVNLCADHQIAETMVKEGDGWLGIADKAAMFSAACMIALTLVGVWFAWMKRTRLFGVCLLLFIGTIGFRMLFIVPEFMPEYRIYPGMPWFCLGAAILLGGLWRWMTPASPVVVASLILLPCIVLSAKRSFVWHDLDSLCADTLKHYPAQGRAVWELHDRDMARGDWEKIIERQRKVWPGVMASFIGQYRNLQPARDLNSGHFALADVASAGRYAIALAHTDSPAAGVREIRQLEARMRQLGIREEDNPTIWGFYHHARATVMELAGDYPRALESMRFSGVVLITPTDIERVERKLRESSGSQR